ncbi:hypothetical protein ACN08Y_07930 [Rothia sp. P5764]|uniref:hypothetical protein n=1 Tax=Rothia sp. P5764 TaxID=3402654 RepID=UPI003ABF913F
MNPKTAFSLLALALTLLTTSCTHPEQRNNPNETVSSAPIITNSAGSSSNYVEVNGRPGLTEDQLKPELKNLLDSARSINSPFLIIQDTIYWLDPTVPYKERVLLEHEVTSDWKDHPIRWVDGIGTGTLTIYRHGADSYIRTVK